jgi:hypothetical protein
MAESEIHRRLKLALAKELVEMGYQSGVEIPTGDGGYIDVQGRRGKEFINIEIVRSHTPEWLVFKIQKPEEIKRNLFEGVLNRIPRYKDGHFSVRILIEMLLETGYFDIESVEKYIDKMIERRIIAPSYHVHFNSKKQQYICDCKDFINTQKECSHISKHKAEERLETILAESGLKLRTDLPELKDELKDLLHRLLIS